MIYMIKKSKSKSEKCVHFFLVPMWNRCVPVTVKGIKSFAENFHMQWSDHPCQATHAHHSTCLLTTVRSTCTGVSSTGAEQLLLLLLPLLLLSTKYLIVKVCHAEQRKVATTNDDDAAATNFLVLPKKQIVKMSPAPWNPEPVSLAADQQEEYQHSKFKSIPMRPSPIVHPAVDAPICPECQALEMTFFNPDCKGCQYELETMAHHGIGIASIFAILRQWIPQVRHFQAYIYRNC